MILLYNLYILFTYNLISWTDYSLATMDASQVLGVLDVSVFEFLHFINATLPSVRFVFFEDGSLELAIGFCATLGCLAY